MIIFDFDGVLIDSLDEVAITAYNASTGKTAETFVELPPNYLSLFRKNRFHVRPAGDFITFASWCIGTAKHSPDKLLTEDEYLGLFEREVEGLHERKARFFAARGNFLSSNRQQWLSLHSPYQPIWNVLRNAVDETLVLLTNKNRAAVLELCEYFGLRVSAGDIYSGDGSGNKVANFKAIDLRFRCQYYYFLDDSINNLLDLQRSVVSKEFIPLLADWGYAGPADWETAREQGIRVVAQKEAIDIFRNNIFKAS